MCVSKKFKNTSGNFIRLIILSLINYLNIKLHLINNLSFLHFRPEISRAELKVSTVNLKTLITVLSCMWIYRYMYIMTIVNLQGGGLICTLFWVFKNL